MTEQDGPLIFERRVRPVSFTTLPPGAIVDSIVSEMKQDAAITALYYINKARKAQGHPCHAPFTPEQDRRRIRFDKSLFSERPLKGMSPP